MMGIKDRGFPDFLGIPVITEDQVESAGGYLVDMWIRGLSGEQSKYLREVIDRGYSRCANCLFYESIGGVCAKNAPAGGSGGDGFPGVSMNMICGDYERGDSA